MQKLLNYICQEMDDLEKRLDSGNLTLADMQYGDLLAHFKKNLLTAEAMMERDRHKSSYDDGHDRMDNKSGRMSRTMSRNEAKDDLIRHLKSIANDSNDEEIRQMVHNWIRDVE